MSERLEKSLSKKNLLPWIMIKFCMEHNPYLLDSSVWIALFYENDTLHSDAVAFFELLDKKRQIIVPECVIFEVCNVLTYKNGPEKA